MILITGGAGYIGSHVALKLLENNQDIVIFDSLENSKLDIINTLKTIKNFEFVKGDLKNIKEVEYLFNNYRINAVMHFAAYIRVEESVKNPKKYYYNNLFGTLNLINMMIEHKVNKIIFSSTAAIYGKPKYIPIDENHPKNPINPYGKSKLMIEEILDDYEIAYGLKSIKLRYFNVAGADKQNRIGESHVPETHLIPNILKSIANPEKIFYLFGNDYKTHDGTCIRDYVNIEDLAEAHLSALNYLELNNKSDSFNIGTEKGSSVKEIFRTCEQITNKKIKVKISPRRKGDSGILIASNEKASKLLNWKPQRSLQDSIITAFNWIKKL